ncbi:MAG: RnfABCDGE type electron transport complex subunit G [Ruminococcaceae bacterium]|nr:RnfABCDGE type electron transport complex subunit G [Oscillospiraceae bacterium]
MKEKKKSKSQILRLTLILFLVSALTSGVLGYTNSLTADRIKEQKQQATAKAYNEVLPFEGDYVEVTEFDKASFPTVDTISKAGEEGYVVEMTFSGAQGNITAVVGVDSSHKATGVSVISHSETPSLGARITEEGFRAKFVGAEEGTALKNAGGTIEAITSATISSQAIVDSVNTAIAAVVALG